MKKLVFLLLMALVMPVVCAAVEAGPPAGTAPATEAPVEKTRYIIHLTNGGAVETDNYTIEKDTVRVMLPSGAIYLDKNNVKDIEEVKGEEGQTVKTIEVAPTPAETPKPAGAPKETAPPPASQPYVPKDNDGHTESWWKGKVDEWKKKKADAEARYKKAEDDWNNYNGILGGLSSDGSVSQFDITKYQDLRGAARVEMDKARGDLDEADNMLSSVLPDQARKAGAPPGWVR